MSEPVVEALGRLNELASTRASTDELPRFALRSGLDAEALRHRVEALAPWREGPFALAGDVVAGAGAESDRRLPLEAIGSDLRGKRVVVLGGALFAAFTYAQRGAEVVAGALGQALEQARLLASVYALELDLREGGWDVLEGQFDLVHCDGLLHAEPHPARLLERLRALLAPDGTLLLRSATLADPEQSDYALVLASEGHWFVPGRLTRRWMLEVAGLIEAELLRVEPGDGTTVYETVSARGN